MSASSRPPGRPPADSSPAAFDAEWEAPEGPTLDAEGRLTGGRPRAPVVEAPAEATLEVDRRGWEAWGGPAGHAAPTPAHSQGEREEVELAYTPVHDSKARRPAEYAPVQRSHRRPWRTWALGLAVLAAGVTAWRWLGRPGAEALSLPGVSVADARRLLAPGGGGVLTLTSEPAGARVRIDGREVGTTPWAGDNSWPAGDVSLELTLPGHRPWKGRFRGGEDVTLQVQLKRAR